MRLTPIALALALALTTAHAAIPIVTDGRADAIILIPDRPSEITKYAAAEFAWHVEKASGAKLSIVHETAAPAAPAHRIYIGSCQAAGAPDFKTPEAALLRTTANSLFILGDDSGGDPLDQNQRAGTLWGVYEWLERALQVRWLWPGEFGTFVPKAQTIASPDLSEQIAPHFSQRKLRTGLGYVSEHPALGFTKAAAEKYERGQSIFLRRHRMGRSVRFSYGHAFTEWWKTDGAAHPEWFQLLENGKRGPSKSTARFSMCVSNPEFQREIVERWKAKSKPEGKTPSFLNAVENDFLGRCTCEPCRAWDGHEPADYLTYYSPKSKMAGSRFVSDRYARFWLNLQGLAAKADPNATVIGYVYFNYFQAPTSGVKLSDRILLGFCPSGGFFPRSAEEHAWMKQQWLGWRNTGARLFLRTNHLLDGYTMPFLYAQQFADEFQHAARHGMVATDFDSLTGQWATQGPTLYVALRLHTHPKAKVENLLAEFYAGFGTAAEEVKGYFAHWERYTTEQRARLAQTFDALEASRWRNWAKAAHVIYPAECFVAPATLLDQAAETVKADAGALSRIRFLQLGLQHAKLCSAVSAQLTLAGPSPIEPSPALAALLKFRREHETSGIGNFNHSAWVEDLSWHLGSETKAAPEFYP